MYATWSSYPRITQRVIKGNFVLQQFAKKFGLIAKDQTHEQSNKSLQAHGGAVGLYESPEALALFILAGPCTVHIGLRPTTFIHRSSRGRAQLASQVLQGCTIVCRRGSAHGKPFHCHTSGACCTRYTECHGTGRCYFSISNPCSGLSPSRSICHGNAGKGFSTNIRYHQAEQHVHLRQPT